MDCQTFEIIYTGRKYSGLDIKRTASLPVNEVYMVLTNPFPGARITISILTTTTVETKYGA
jgi:hypothetical protein